MAEDIVLDGLNNDDRTFISNTSFGIGNPGNISISARNITFQNGANISIFGTSQQDSNIGEITLKAKGDILFDGITSQISGILNSLPEGVTGDIGAINIQAQNLTLTNGAIIQSQVSGRADGGDINIDIANSTKIDGFDDFSTENVSGVLASNISSIVVDTGVGNAGNININTQNLELSRNGAISADVSGQGNGGDININAEQITIGKQGNTRVSPSFISAETLAEAKGNGGNITINTGSLSISDGGDIDVGISGVGDGGNIKISARDTITVDGTGILFSRSQQKNVNVSSGILADVAPDSTGDAGTIEIDTAKLSVTNGAFVSTDILEGGSGNSGSIDIRATDIVEASGGGGIEVDLYDNTSGNGGNLNIETKKLTVSNGSSISAVTFGSGNAGNLMIRATDSIELSDVSENGRGGLFASAIVGSGNGGNLSVFTNELIIRDGAIISASNFPSIEGLTEPGTGQPGNIKIEANSILLQNEGIINAATQSEIGEGANIDLQVADSITLQNNSFISAEALNNANGGNINIDTNFIIAVPNQNNDIIASAEQGRGGNITINAESLFGIQERAENDLTNDINASSDFGLDGNVSIRLPDINALQGTTELPGNFVELQQTTAQACSVNRESIASNSFVINGKGGIMPTPDAPLNSQDIIINGELTRNNNPPVQPIVTSQGNIIPARGVTVTKDGKVILTTYRTTNSGDRIPVNSVNCH